MNEYSRKYQELGRNAAVKEMVAGKMEYEQLCKWAELPRATVAIEIAKRRSNGYEYVYALASKKGNERLELGKICQLDWMHASALIVRWLKDVAVV